MPRNNRSRASLWLCLLSAAFIVYGTTIPFRFLPTRRLVQAKWQRLTFNPLYPNKTGRLLSFPDAAQNVLLFLPIGIFGVGALHRAQPPGRRILSPGGRILAVIAAGAALSTTVEAIQLIDIGRTASVADIMSNTLGTAIGAFASTSVLDALARFVRRLKRLGALDTPASFPLLVGLLVVCVAAWEPFDVTLDLGVGVRKLTRLGNDLWQANGRANSALEALRFLMLTVLAASSLRALGLRRSRALAVGACGLLAVVLEVSQMLITSRMPGLADVSINIAGAMAGGFLIAPLARVPSLRIWYVLLVAATWLAAMLPALSPYNLSPAYEPFWQLTLGFGRYNWARVIGHISELILMCFPLGFALPWVVRRTSRAYLTAITVAVIFECSLAAVERSAGALYPNVADVVVATMGALGGAWVGRAGRHWFLDIVGFLDVVDAVGRPAVGSPP